MKTQAKKLTAFLLALVLVVSGLLTVSVRAVEGTPPNEEKGTPDDPRKLAPVMRVVFPEGTEFDQTFEFELKQKQDLYRGENADYVNDKVKDLEDSHEVEVSNSKNESGFEGRTSVGKPIDDLFEGANWPKPGYYVFTLKQVLPEEATDENGYVAKSTTDDTTKIKYDPAVYRIEVDVRTGGNDGEETVNYVHRIGAIQIVDHDGSKVLDTENPDKLETDPCKAGLLEENLDGCVYFKNIVNVISDDALKISKEVKGDDDIVDKKTDFPFELKLENPDPELIIGEPPKSYKGRISEGKWGVKKEDGIHNGLVFKDGYADISLSETFKLKHDERLILDGVLVGTKWRAAETDSKGYTPTAKVIVGGEEIADLSETTTAADNKSTIATPAIEASEFNLLKEGKNVFAVTNTFKKDEPPTGLFYDNLPFIVLLGLAALGIIFFVAKKTRRKEQEQA